MITRRSMGAAVIRGYDKYQPGPRRSVSRSLAIKLGRLGEKKMRTVAFSVGIALGIAYVFSSAFAAPVNPWCFGIFPIDIVDCKDRALTALHKKVERLYADALSQAGGLKRDTLIVERNKWIVSRGGECGVNVIE
jgi:hypothetical protein